MKRLVLPLLLVTVMAGACDARQSDDGTAGIASANGGSGATSTTGASRWDVRAWARCMRQHGQNVPDQPDKDPNGATGAPPGGAAGAAWRTARAACRAFESAGVDPPVRPAPMDTATLEKLREFAVCMRAHGLEMTDPNPQTGNMRIGGRFNDFNRQQAERDPTYKAALDACKDKLPDETGKKRAER